MEWKSLLSTPSFTVQSYARCVSILMATKCPHVAKKSSLPLMPVLLVEIVSGQEETLCGSVLARRDKNRDMDDEGWKTFTGHCLSFHHLVAFF